MRSAAANRFFQDEINAATTPVLETPIWQNFSWPERLSDVHSVVGIASLGRAVTTNRFFQDEINAAGALDLGDLQSPFFTWPKRQIPNAVVAVVRAVQASPLRSATINRFFLNEIAGAKAMSGDETLPAPEVTSQHGPR